MSEHTPLSGSTQDQHDGGFDVADLEEAASPRRVGRYVLAGELGRGGMGVVYRARDPELGRDVAIKLVRNRASVLAATRLLREAQAIARLTHPNVVAVHDVGSIHDQLYVAMELVAGTSLRHWLARARHGLPALLDVFAQAARGLAAAHDAGLVHRDFKPDNVLVGDDGRVRVADFGLARLAERDAPFAAPARAAGLAIDHSVTRAGAAVGTPRYMSPEQILGGDVDARADQFSFCVALYEAVAQQRPYVAHDLDGLAAAIIAGELQPVPAAAAVPAWLERLLRRGLAAAPAARWSSMHDLVDELVADRAGERNAALDGMGTTDPMIAAFPPRAADVARIAVLRAQLERAWGKKSRGDLAGASLTARALVADTARLDYPPLRAAALYLLGNLEHRTGDSLTARATLLSAAQVAARVGDDWQLANVWVFLVLVASVGLGRHEEASAFAACAEVALARTGHNPALQSRLDNHRGLAAAAAGNHDEAAAHHAAAVLRDEQTHGPRHAFLVLSLLHLGEALLAAGRIADAAPPLARAADILDLDADQRPSPSRARCLSLLAALATREGRVTDAAALTIRADAVRASLPR